MKAVMFGKSSARKAFIRHNPRSGLVMREWGTLEEFSTPHTHPLGAGDVNFTGFQKGPHNVEHKRGARARAAQH